MGTTFEAESAASSVSSESQEEHENGPEISAPPTGTPSQSHKRVDAKHEAKDESSGENRHKPITEPIDGNDDGGRRVFIPMPPAVPVDESSDSDEIKDQELPRAARPGKKRKKKHKHSKIPEEHKLLAEAAGPK